MSTLTLIAPILLQGMQMWAEERRLRFSNEHKEILDKLSKAQNAKPGEYTDYDLDILGENYEIFMTAYAKEQKEVLNG